MALSVNVLRLPAVYSALLLLDFHFAKGVNIKLETGNNVQCGMNESLLIRCTSERYGVVFKFTQHKTTDTARLAECQFGQRAYSQLMNARFKDTYNVTYRKNTCILTLLYLTEGQRGTYTCSELYEERECVSRNVTCNGRADVASDVTGVIVQNDSGKTGIIIGLTMSVLVVCIIVGVICRKRIQRCIVQMMARHNRNSETDAQIGEQSNRLLRDRQDVTTSSVANSTPDDQNAQSVSNSSNNVTTDAEHAPCDEQVGSLSLTTPDRELDAGYSHSVMNLTARYGGK